MNRILPGFASFLTISSVSASVSVIASEFGSDHQARDAAERVIAVFAESGLDAAIALVNDPENGFGLAPLGVNLLHDGRLVADNREPETVGSDYTAVMDLEGERLWPRIGKVLADGGDELVILWTHYDTGAPYAYRCVLRRSNDALVIAMICI